ncbi:MAG: nucleotidyltransferase family protein [Gammaproteobacteria bacterium]|nr:nucleotidyltransferase family protein [Gammaproteobacteria bacterium]MCP4091675.1 nucleotidyltransferase family protein [Gammaproteobacteria bacterium]MCP4276171.1 nucleotidyltransferase family protein [Gammaproteobacteria bacterium]MCP4831805.1 nucleotidyltransferase family protein [Gammaproteobacteria bacterium]MCP4929741.1 nucleotidyltransferase family protein [Gammaproteobacteria bacterium]
MNPGPAKLAGIILAAGSSERLGQPKQLVKWEGITLVRRAAGLALGVCNAGVSVVVGVAARQIATELNDLNVAIVDNKNWQMGMGSSLNAGLQALEQDADGLLLMLCDQPGITSDDLSRLVNIWKNKTDSPVAAAYSGTVGVPAILPVVMLPLLDGMSYQRGAGSLLRGYSDTVLVEMPSAAWDIDTAADLQWLRDNDENGNN